MSPLFAFAQLVQHSSVDIPNPSAFYAAQKRTNWCWAACNQMLLNAKGIPENQDHQVQKLFEEIINQGAGGNYESAKLALAGMYTDVNGNSVAVVPYISYLGTHANDPIVIINQLSYGIPLVMATSMHGRVCVGVDYDTIGTIYLITKMRL
jgi:Papain-like cysteine protease AvrRpt2